MSDNPQVEVEIADNSSPTLATSALQSAGNTTLSSIDSKTPSLVGGRQPVDGSGVTQPISAASLPLPTGAATSLVEGTVSPGTAATKSELAGAVYNSTPPTLSNAQQAALQSDVNGNLKVSIGAATVSVVPVGTLATYAATIVGLVAATNPTDIVLIKGSASKVVKIGRILISGYQTNASLQDVLIIKRSADNTGGTRAAMTAVSFDSTDGAATAQVFSYTANPSALGTSLGTVRAIEGTFPNKSGSTGNPVLLEISNPPQKPITLENANEYLAINLNALSMPGSYLTITVEWTEQ